MVNKGQLLLCYNTGIKLSERIAAVIFPVPLAPFIPIKRLILDTGIVELIISTKKPLYLSKAAFVESCINISNFISDYEAILNAKTLIK